MKESSFVIIDLYSMTGPDSERLLDVLEAMGVPYQMVANVTDYEVEDV